MNWFLRLLIPCLFLAIPSAAQSQDSKPTADTLAVQADAVHEADPDLATLRFHISVTEKELRKAYDRASLALQRILQLAERNGLTQPDVTTGPMNFFPEYDWNDRKRRIRTYRVEGDVWLKLRDFSKIGSLMDEAVQDGITEFSSLTYSLADEEASKQRAVGEAMRRAEARARAALGQNGQRLGALRYANVDVKQVTAVQQVDLTRRYQMMEQNLYLQRFMAPGFPEHASSPAVPVSSPERIRVTASVQCVFQLQ